MSNKEEMSILERDFGLTYKEVPKEKQEEQRQKMKEMNDEIMLTKIDKMDKAKDAEKKLLQKIKEAYLDNNEAEFYKFQQIYSGTSEKNFLFGKTFRLYKITDKTIIDVEQNENLFAPKCKGECDYFDAKVEKINDDYFIFTLPQLLPTRNRTKTFWEGEFMPYIVKNLSINFYKENQIILEKFDQATLVFEHHINTTTNSNVYPDADNLEAKLVTDAFQLFFLNNDTLRDINTLHIGKTDKEDYTKVHIINQPYMQNWMEKHAHLFYEK